MGADGIIGWYRRSFSNFFILFQNCYLAAPWPTLGHYRGGSFTHPMLITCILHAGGLQLQLKESWDCQLFSTQIFVNTCAYDFAATEDRQMHQNVAICSTYHLG